METYLDYISFIWIILQNSFIDFLKTIDPLMAVGIICLSVFITGAVLWSICCCVVKPTLSQQDSFCWCICCCPAIQVPPSTVVIRGPGHRKVAPYQHQDRVWAVNVNRFQDSGNPHDQVVPVWSVGKPPVTMAHVDI